MFTQAARALFDAHERRERFAPLPPHLAPRSVSDAHAIQDAFVALRAGKLGAIAGYKIALTSPQMRKFVGVDEPRQAAELGHAGRRRVEQMYSVDRMVDQFSTLYLNELQTRGRVSARMRVA